MKFRVVLHAESLSRNQQMRLTNRPTNRQIERWSFFFLLNTEHHGIRPGICKRIDTLLTCTPRGQACIRATRLLVSLGTCWRPCPWGEGCRVAWPDLGCGWMYCSAHCHPPGRNNGPECRTQRRLSPEYHKIVINNWFIHLVWKPNKPIDVVQHYGKGQSGSARWEHPRTSAGCCANFPREDTRTRWTWTYSDRSVSKANDLGEKIEGHYASIPS